MNVDEIMKVNNLAIVESFFRADDVIRRHDNIAISISGGSDSDIVLDLIERVKGDQEIRYIWFDTGLEYKATKDHLTYLEDKYHIKIERIKAVKPIPLCCHEYGSPFISKYVSGMIERLQKHGFEWEDKPLEELLEKYSNCQQALKWWCSANKVSDGCKETMFNINHNRYLKEFMIAHPPDFKISARCCEYAKKKVSEKFIKSNEIDLMVIGIRRAEGGIRAGIYKTCYSPNQDTADQYRPIFYYTDADKQFYEEEFGVDHSGCYTVYGFRRTGCVGCPFALDFEENLKKTKIFEPKLYNACNHVFGKSYEYTRQYKLFRAEMKAREENQGQLTFKDLIGGDGNV